MTYHYTMCGLDYVFLKNGYRVHDTDYGKGVSIERADELDRVLAGSLATSHARLRGQEVRFLRSLLHCSQTGLANRLGVKRLTVARWEGAPHTPVPGPADRLLRLVVAKALFGGQCLDTVMDLLPEIADERPGKLFMIYKPDEKPSGRTLFPFAESDANGWHPAKAA